MRKTSKIMKSLNILLLASWLGTGVWNCKITYVLSQNAILTLPFFFSRSLWNSPIPAQDSWPSRRRHSDIAVHDWHFLGVVHLQTPRRGMRLCLDWVQLECYRSSLRRLCSPPSRISRQLQEVWPPTCLLFYIIPFSKTLFVFFDRWLQTKCEVILDTSFWISFLCSFTWYPWFCSPW